MPAVLLTHTWVLGPCSQASSVLTPSPMLPIKLGECIGETSLSAFDKNSQICVLFLDKLSMENLLRNRLAVKYTFIIWNKRLGQMLVLIIQSAHSVLCQHRSFLQHNNRQHNTGWRSGGGDGKGWERGRERSTIGEHCEFRRLKYWRKVRHPLPTPVSNK